jgi:hypothetical protein
VSLTITRSTEDPPEIDRCAVCGTSLAAEQEWCLHCGTARTRVHTAPDWRLPLVIVTSVVLVAAAIFVFALVRATNRADTVPALSPSATPTGALSGTATWPPGLDGFTVVLASSASRTAALAKARMIGDSGIADVGVLATSAHPEMHPPGVFDVFAGRYPTAAAAEAAATRIASRGNPSARVQRVQRPGGP